MRTKFILIIIVVFSVTTELIAQENDIIRRKIENRNIIPMSCFGEPILCTQSLPAFYQNTFFEIAWNQTSAQQLIEAISKAANEGLNPEDYHLKILNEIQAKPFKSDFEEAEFDLLLTDAYMLYISHLVSGKINPVTIDPEWHVVKGELDVKRLFSSESMSNINTTIESILPQHPTYTGLKEALKRYHLIENRVWENLSVKTTIKPEMEDEVIPLVRERLLLLRDLSESFSENSKVYDEKLVDAVKNFQARHGLVADGEIGQKTINALNIPINQRIEQVEASLERWRWLPKEFGNYYIIVNIANFELEVYKNNMQERQHKVIVGKPFRQTPVFHSQMQYLVLNPTWTIPPGILIKDIIPSVKRDSGYLNTKKIDVLNSEGKLLNSTDIDWSNPIVKSYTYRQSAGPENSLGSVKFMFPNSFHVYLHDTPAKELFEKGERAYSSGCIRVQEPLLLAEYLLNDSTNYSLLQLQNLVKARKTQSIKLKEQPNVYLLYWTAWLDSDGRVNFRDDIYKRDDAVVEALAQKPAGTVYSE